MAGQHQEAVKSDRAVRTQVAEGPSSAPSVAGQGGRGPGPARSGRHQRRDVDQLARRAQSGIPEAGRYIQGGPVQAGGTELVFVVGQAGRREQGTGPGAGVAPAAAVPAADRHPGTSDQKQNVAERCGACAGEQVDGHTFDHLKTAGRVRQGRAVPVHAASEGTQSRVGTHGGASTHAILARLRAGMSICVRHYCALLGAKAVTTPNRQNILKNVVNKIVLKLKHSEPESIFIIFVQ